MELHAEGQDKRAAISCFKKLRSCKGIFYVALSLDCRHTCSVCLVKGKCDTRIVFIP